MSSLGAVVVRHAQGRAFVRIDTARRVVPQPTLSRVPGSALSMALVAGRVVSVCELEEPSAGLLVCEIGGELVGFAGLGIERVGFYPAEGDRLRVEGHLLPELGLKDLLERESVAWRRAR